MMKTRESSQTYVYFFILLSPIIILLLGAWYFPQTDASLTINLSWHSVSPPWQKRLSLLRQDAGIRAMKLLI